MFGSRGAPAGLPACPAMLWWLGLAGVPPTPPSKPVKSRSKSPTVDELLDTQNNNNAVESDLESLSKGLDNMLLKEGKREEGMLKPKEQEGKEKEPLYQDAASPPSPLPTHWAGSANAKPINRATFHLP